MVSNNSNYQGFTGLEDQQFTDQGYANPPQQSEADVVVVQVNLNNNNNQQL